MFTAETSIRVRYSETDKMGYVYYAHYASYFEVARVEALRSLGISYRQMEDQGILLPVHSYSIKYLKPAFYDDLLNIKTTIREIPTAARIHFEYETYGEKGELLNTAQTTLVFLSREHNRPCPAPDWIKKKFEDFFK